MEDLMITIEDIADQHNLYGDINHTQLSEFMAVSITQAALYISDIFTDQDGGEASDSFYIEILELFEDFKLSN